jgi:hypothetical protein
VWVFPAGIAYLFGCVVFRVVDPNLKFEQKYIELLYSSKHSTETKAGTELVHKKCMTQGIPLLGSGGMSVWKERRNKVASVAQYHVRVPVELCLVHIWQSRRQKQHCQHEAARKS